jgi:NhaA family Na+:H+ antiporter
VASASSSRSRQTALPIAAAIGGMVVPASICFLTNGGGMESRVWAIPMATDITFASSQSSVDLFEHSLARESLG